MRKKKSWGALRKKWSSVLRILHLLKKFFKLSTRKQHDSIHVLYEAGIFFITAYYCWKYEEN